MDLDKSFFDPVTVEHLKGLVLPPLNVVTLVPKESLSLSSQVGHYLLRTNEETLIAIHFLPPSLPLLLLSFLPSFCTYSVFAMCQLRGI